MVNEKSHEAIEAYKMFKSAFEAEDTAYSSRSNNLLTLNSLLALAFVGILQKGFNPDWRPILIFCIPIVAIFINVIWLWLGCRTWLSFVYYFKQIWNLEESVEPKYFYFNYAKSRNEFWDENKKGITSLVSHLGGANRLFCFWLPRAIYIIWTALIVFVISKYTSCIVTIFIALVFFIPLATFYWIASESRKRHEIKGKIGESKKREGNSRGE